MHTLKKVCYMTTLFTAIHFFYDSVIISWQHLKQCTCQGNCLYFTIIFATIHYNKRSAVNLRKSWKVCLFEENHCSPAVWKVAIYSTEQVAITFIWKVVKCTKALTEVPFFTVNQHSEITVIFSKKWNTVRSLKVNETKFTLRNVFILDLFALGGEKDQNITKGPLFWGSVQKHLAFERPIYASFRTILVLGIFGVFLLFLDIKFIKFTSSRPFFEVVCSFI